LVDVLGCAEPGCAPGLFAEYLGQAGLELVNSRVWVPRMSSGLCDLGIRVLVDQAVEPVPAMDYSLAGRWWWRGWPDGRGLVEGTVRSVGVVVIYVDREYVVELAAGDDQDPVEKLAA
jgi:hypothetical protein